MSRNKWYEKSGPEGDIIVSTRVRLARNLKDYPFPSRMTADQINCVNKAVWDAVPDKENYDFVELSSLSSAERLALCQQHLISPEFAEKNDGRAVIMNKDRSICIMLCEEDHVRIQVLCAGFDLKEAYGAAEKIESALEKKLHFAFDKDLGYLTECPTNLGTGMRASVMIHLPALEAANGIEALSRAVGKIGLTLRGTYGEGSGANGSLYQLSNQITLGIDEKSAIENLSAVTKQVTEKELAARKTVNRDSLEDTVYRSLGLLKSARMLSGAELSKHLSNLRLGGAMGMEDIPSPEILNTLENELCSGEIAAKNKDCNTPEKRDKIRAAAVREKLK